MNAEMMAVSLSSCESRLARLSVYQELYEYRRDSIRRQRHEAARTVTHGQTPRTHKLVIYKELWRRFVLDCIVLQCPSVVSPRSARRNDEERGFLYRATFGRITDTTTAVLVTLWLIQKKMRR